MYKLGCFGTITGYDSQSENSVCIKCALNKECRVEAIRIKDAILQQVTVKNIKDGMSEAEALKESKSLSALFDVQLNIATAKPTKKVKLSALASSIVSPHNPHAIDSFDYFLYEGFKIHRDGFRASDIVEHVAEKTALHASLQSDIDYIRKTVTRVIKELQANGYIVKEATTLCLKFPS